MITAYSNKLYTPQKRKHVRIIVETPAVQVIKHMLHYIFVSASISRFINKKRTVSLFSNDNLLLNIIFQTTISRETFYHELELETWIPCFLYKHAVITQLQIRRS